MSSAPRAVCVRGPTDALGETLLCHEFLLFDLRSRLVPPATAEETMLRDAAITLERLSELRSSSRTLLANLQTPPVEAVLQELTALRAGRPPFACTVVDATLAGRSLPDLLALSERSGVNIVASTGMTADEATAAASAAAMADEDADPLAEKLIDELLHGVDVPCRDGGGGGGGGGGNARVRCGCISVGDGIYASDTARDAILHACGHAQMRTGAPVVFALPAPSSADGGAAPRAACAMVRALVETHRAAAASVVVAHAQNLLVDAAAAGEAAAMATGREALRELLQLGVRLCFDGFGCTWAVAGPTAAGAAFDALLTPPSDATIARELASLIGQGFGEQLVLSSGVESRLHLSHYGGGGFQYIPRVFCQHLARVGVGAEQSLALCGARSALGPLLSFWQPAGPAARLCRPWECAGCHRSFEEAVNPAEELPTDQSFYEKYDARYCSMHCLSSHRKAGFVLPFSCAPPAAT